MAVSGMNSNGGGARSSKQAYKKDHPAQQASGASFEDVRKRLFLAVACLWPFGLFALMASSAPHILENHVARQREDVVSPHRAVSAGSSAAYGLRFRDVLDRADIMGYGPTHPRVAVVIVGDNRDSLVSSVESVFGHTDMNRIFMVVVVVDGHKPDEALTDELKKIDAGAIPHWHGLRPDLHTEGQTADEDEDDPHGNKVHVFFNEKKRGLAECRKDAVDFLQILEKHHLETGLKSPQEDIILLLLQSGAQLTDRHWLGPVTDALIVPPPILGKGDTTVAMKIANAIAFNLEGPGKRTSFDTTFTPVISEASADEINQSSGSSYPTPALNGAATALRLDTYVNLPSQDLSLQGDWPVNLDLALNLWLCADGIDMLKDVTVTSFEQTPPVPLAPSEAARFAAAWMDEVTSKKFFSAYTKSNPELTYLEWETHVGSARQTPHFTTDLTQKCRSFQWYAEEVNPELNDLLEKSIAAGAQDKSSEKQKQQGERTELKVVQRDEMEAADELPDKPLPVPEANEDDTLPDLSKDIHKAQRKPSKPLCQECLEIVQKATPVDISFVDVSGGHNEHPHRGARDEHGNWGYVHDETALRRNPDPFDIPNNELRAHCEKRDNNWRMLNYKVFVDMKYDESMIGKPRDKIFCLVYTTEAGHPRVPRIRRTWGPKCDGFMVASTKTDPALGTVEIPHEGAEEYNNIWQKVRSMWSYVYDNYYEKYDWFHIGGDDLYLLVENLRYYVESEEIKTASNGGIYLPNGDETVQTPLFMGRRFAYQGDMSDIFNSGGSGYTMNKAALKRLVVDGFPNKFPHAHTFSEDTMTARIFRNYGVFPYETKDETGGERYMPFMPGHHYGYRMPQDHSKDWYARYSIDIKEGLDHCSARSIAFHYVKDAAMDRLHAILYHQCPEDLQWVA